MSVKERDPYTGHMTTGHDWNGIKELNTPVPWILIICLVGTFLFSVGYWVLMPSFPSVNSFAKGALGVDQTELLQEQLQLADARKSVWSNKLETSSFDDIVADKDLMQIVQEAGPALFKDNCAMCHGQQGEGDVNFPRLNDDAWLWGGTPSDVYKTLQVGINSAHAQSRIAQMPAFGETGVLDSDAIKNVALYVQSLSVQSIGSGRRVDELLDVKQGKEVFESQCAACHGIDGSGNTLLGAPAFTDPVWIYGSDEESIYQTLWSGRAGHMPYWDQRLTVEQLKLLSLYVISLSDETAVIN